MTFNQLFSRFFSSFKIFSSIYNKIERSNKYKHFFYLSLIFISFLTFLTVYNLINQKDKAEEQNFKSVIKSDEFLNFSNFIFSRISSPYKEFKYSVQNNDSIEKILKNFKVSSKDIKAVSNGLNKKKLTNIYAGKELYLVLKMGEDGSRNIINLAYPINNTTSVEIRKVGEEFNFNEKILKLYKKEVVIKIK